MTTHLEQHSAKLKMDSDWIDLLMRRGIESILNHFMRTYRLTEAHDAFLLFGLSKAGD
jgi:hypothetical protein